jgi:actin-related protein 8
MKLCTAPLLPAAPKAIPAPTTAVRGNTENDATIPPAVIPGTPVLNSPVIAASKPGTPTDAEISDIKPLSETAPVSRAPSPALQPAVPSIPALSDVQLLLQSSQVPLDAAIAASIACCGTENKCKAAASSILLIGGGSAMGGLGAFLSER